MKIYIIRHGLTELNKKGLINGNLDDALAPEGILQAKMMAKDLPKTIQHIYSSSLERAKQTAKIINEVLQVPLTFHDELKEVNFGILNGTPYSDEFKEKHKMQNYDWRPSGECFEDVKERTLKILREIKENNPPAGGDGTALVVAHGGTIRMLHKLETEELLNEIENASLHSFDLDRILKKKI